jgi:hypothetical protein
VLETAVTHQTAIKLLQQSVGVVRLVVTRTALPIPAPSGDDDDDVAEERTVPTVTTAPDQPEEMVLQSDWTQVGWVFGFGVASLQLGQPLASHGMRQDPSVSPSLNL